MNEEKNTTSDNDWTRNMAFVNDAFAKDPEASINVMLRTMAFTARQTGRSFLVRHENNSNNVVWLYHLGGETDIRIIHIESLFGEWLGLEPRAAAWPTTGEQFERLQREADEHIKDPLGREALLRRMRVWGPPEDRKKLGPEMVREELGRAIEEDPLH